MWDLALAESRKMAFMLLMLDSGYLHLLCANVQNKEMPDTITTLSGEIYC